MSLKFFTLGKPDTRMVEYSQDILRLGEERAQLSNEMERKKKDIHQMNIEYDKVRGVFLRNYEKLTDEENAKVKQKAETLISFDDKVERDKKELRVLEERKKKLDILIEDKTKTSKYLEKSIINLEEKISWTDVKMQAVKTVKERKEQEKNFVVGEFNKEQQRLDSIREKLHTVSLENNAVKEDLERKKKELEQLNEIVSILKSSNQDGLDVVASFDGERKRLQEKDEFLLRKERDLGVYERRLEKYFKEAGKEVTMIFK